MRITGFGFNSYSARYNKSFEAKIPELPPLTAKVLASRIAKGDTFAIIARDYNVPPQAIFDQARIVTSQGLVPKEDMLTVTKAYEAELGKVKASLTFPGTNLPKMPH